MSTYTVTYTETEDMAMHYVAVSADEWIQNAAHERARLAIDEIVTAVFANGWVKSAEQRNAEVAVLLTNA